MGALGLSLTLFAVGLALFWGGYYVALITAWRAGVRGVGTAIGLAAGLCCCGGVAVLAMHWEKIQRHTFEAIAEGGDADVLGARLRRFRIASAVAVAGMVLQLFAGYLVPEDDEYAYSDDSYSGGSYSDDSYSEGSYSDDSHSDEAHSDEAHSSDEAREVDAEDEEDGADEPSEASDEDLGDAEGEHVAQGEHVDEEQPASPVTSGILIGLSRDRRAAFVLDPGGGRWVIRERGRITGLEPGVTVHARGRAREDGVLVVSSLEDSGITPWLDMPRPARLEGELSAPPSDRLGRWVIVPAVRAISATEVMSADGSALRVRAPRGLIASGADYAALRGALVDTRPIDRRGGIELWIAREEDVIAAH